MKLTLGQAAKEVGISKPSLSAAIKKGRVSAKKNDSGTYEIDPAELFRVYPPRANTNTVSHSETLPSANPQRNGQKPGNSEVLGLLLAERDKLIAEKDKSIGRLEHEKDQIRQDLEDQKDQAKRITMLLEDKSNDGAGDWGSSLKALEQRIANQEQQQKTEKERAQKILQQNRALKKALDAEKNKSILQKLFG